MAALPLARERRDAAEAILMLGSRAAGGARTGPSELVAGRLKLSAGG